jgi:Protein of unknown function (DUF1573)
MSVFRSVLGFAGNGVAALAMTMTPASARADLRFTEPAAHAGIVYAGVPLVHEFLFVSQGPEAVAILEAHASCGCAQPRLSKDNFGANEKGSVTLEVNTLSQAPGPHTWTVTLKYRVGNFAREVELQLHARLITEVTVQPAALIVFADRIAQHDVLLTDCRDEPLEILDVHASSAKLLPRIGESTRDAQGHTIRKISLAVADDYPDRRHDEILAIYTDDPRYREIRVPVTVLKHAQQRFAATPSQVELVAPVGQPFPSRILMIRDNQGQEVHIDRILSTDPAVSCRWAPGPGAMATVRVHADRSLLAGQKFGAAIQIQIDHPVHETLVIPVTGTVR